MNARTGQFTVPLGPLVAAVGAVILLVSLFLDWYEGLTAFTVFELVDIVLVVCVLLIVLQLAGGMGLMKPPVSPLVSLLVALFALGVVLTQLLNDPPAVAGGNGPERDIGIWLAVAGTLLMAIGAFLATATISLSIEPQTRDGDATRVDHEAETVGAPPRATRGRDDPPPASP